MYFPPKYDHKCSLELLDLVIQAYNQFHAFEEKTDWKISSEYSLIKELEISESKAEIILRQRGFFDRQYQELLNSFGRQSKKNLPIGFIAKKKSEVYIIFRGTMTAMEWLQNLNFSLKSYMHPDSGKVHEGFLSVYNLLRQDILDTISKMKIKGISVAGHSLGGALATLFVPDLAREIKYRTLRVYTYGSPRVGDNDFVQMYNRLFSHNTFRVANTSDLVVDVPFPAPFLGFMGGHFSHVDTPVVFTMQKDSIDLNHKADSYFEVLSKTKVPWSFFRKFLG